MNDNYSIYFFISLLLAVITFLTMIVFFVKSSSAANRSADAMKEGKINNPDEEDRIYYKSIATGLGILLGILIILSLWFYSNISKKTHSNSQYSDSELSLDPLDKSIYSNYRPIRHI